MSARQFVKVLVVVVAGFFPFAVFGQGIQQSGSVTPNTATIWSSTGVVKGGVTATDSPLTTFGVTRENADAICVSSARQSAAGRNQLCFLASTTGPAKISLQNYGTAAPQNLQFVINGTPVTIPTGGSGFVQYTGSLASGHMPCFSGTAGLVADCGVGAVAGTQYGLAYYTAADAISSTIAGTNGQIPVAATGGAPVFRSLSGDIGSITSGGAVTITSVNGIPFNTTYTANGVLVANGSSAFTSITTANVGYCLLSQGLSSNPIWASCASGAGSAGGANTQVQFNNSTALGGSANLTWVSPTLTIGVAGSTTGKLTMAGDQSGTSNVTIQNPAIGSGYNFNLPATAGLAGQPMISAGGGTAPMTFGTLGIFGGGTNCNAASGTCLDNITGFSSTGFISRTGSGTYAFSLTIPVSSGGTGLASGNSGGILYYSGTGTLASTATLTQYGLVYGGGLGSSPVATAAGTNGQIPVAVTGGAPSFTTLSGDITTVTNAGVVTIANSAISNAKLANAAAYTLKGNFTGSSAAPQDSTMGALTNKASPAGGDYLLITDNAAGGQLKYATVSSVASAGSVASINSQTGAITFNAGITNSSTTFYADPAYSGFALQNCTIAVSAAASALTIALKDNGGNNPSSSSPCNVNFRNVTGTVGSTTALQVTSASSLVVSSGSTLGVTSSTAFRLWVVGFNDGGTFRLGVINCAISGGVFGLTEGIPASSTAEGGAGGADNAGVFYTGTAVLSKAYRILGFIEWGASGLTAGTWTTTNLVTVQAFGAGIKKPGDVVQRKFVTTSSATTTSSSTFQNTNVSTGSVALTSAANYWVGRAQADLFVNASNASAIGSVFRDSTNLNVQATGYAGSSTVIAAASWIFTDAPNTTGGNTYMVKLRNNDNVSSVTIAVATGGASYGTIQVEEIMR